MTSPRLGGAARAALVLLAFGDASGYELKRRADRTLRPFFNAPAMSQVYTELDRLETRGLVAATGKARGSRETKHYRLTAAGRDELRRWLADDDLGVTVFKSHLALRLAVGHLADPARLRADVELERERVQRARRDLAAVTEMLDPADARRRWLWLVADWGRQYFAAMISQLDRLGEHLDQLDELVERAEPEDRRIDGPNVSLVPVAQADHEALRTIHVEPAVAARWLEPDPEWPHDDEVHGYAITLTPAAAADGVTVGYIQWAEETDPDYRYAGIDLFVSAEHHGRGIGTEAVRLLAAHLVDDRGFDRLVIDPAADNAAAIACYRKAGFRPVGVMREYEQGADGRWHDGLLMDLLAGELVRP